MQKKGHKMSAFSIERTLAIIKPCAIQCRFSILRRLLSAGLHVLQVWIFLTKSCLFIDLLLNHFHYDKERCVKLSIAQVEDFFRHMRNDKIEWAVNVEEWSSGPLIALCLSHNDAIELWKQLMGPENRKAAKESAPTSIRAMYDGDGNPVYGSECSTSAQHELHFFFPSSKIHLLQSFWHECHSNGFSPSHSSNWFFSYHNWWNQCSPMQHHL